MLTSEPGRASSKPNAVEKLFVLKPCLGNLESFSDQDLSVSANLGQILALRHLNHLLRQSTGIAGFSDNRQLLCLSIALWNGRDPILKERLFGLTNGEGNHGEDVKELYYYLDAVPSYAYARTLYKLPQAPYPYEWLIQENARRRGTTAMEADA